MDDKRCPICNLVNPESSRQCDCGYHFVKKTVEMRKDGFEQRVVVTDFDMRFWSMVKLMVKWAVAAIPATIILVLIGSAVVFALIFLGALFSPLLSR